MDPGDVQPVGSTDGGVRNVGHRIALTTYVGNIVVAAGQTVSGLDIYGKVTFTGTGTLIDCRVRGPVWGQGPTWAAGTPTNDACINSTYNGRGSTIRYCTVDMTGRENVWTDGIGATTSRWSIARSCASSTASAASRARTTARRSFRTAASTTGTTSPGGTAAPVLATRTTPRRTTCGFTATGCRSRRSRTTRSGATTSVAPVPRLVRTVDRQAGAP